MTNAQKHPQTDPHNEHLLLKTNLKQLRLPRISAEFAKLSREAASAKQTYEQYLLGLTELGDIVKCCGWALFRRRVIG